MPTPFKAPATRFAIIVAAVVIWQIGTSAGLISPLFVSTPAGVVRALLAIPTDPGALAALRATGTSILIAFVAGTLLGILVGLLLGLSRLFRAAFNAPLMFLLSTPKSVFLPIFALTFGIGPTAATAFGAFEALFYVAVNVIGGLDLVDERHVRLARAYDANIWHRFSDIILPASMPGLFAALWYGIKHAFLGVIIAELWASVDGVGSLIKNYGESLKTDKVLALIVLLTLVAVIGGTFWEMVERRMTGWRTGPGGVASQASTK